MIFLRRIAAAIVRPFVNFPLIGEWLGWVLEELITVRLRPTGDDAEDAALLNKTMRQVGVDFKIVLMPDGE